MVRKILRVKFLKAFSNIVTVIILVVVLASVAAIAETGLTSSDGEYLSPTAHPLISRRGNDQGAVLIGNNTHLITVWMSDVTGNWDIWVSIYNGSSWTSPMQLTSDKGCDEWPNLALLPGNRIIVVWASDRSGIRETWYKVYLNGKWSEDRKLTLTPNLPQSFPASPRLKWLPGNSIAMSWAGEATSNTTDIFFAKLKLSEDGVLSPINGTLRKLTNADNNQWLKTSSILLKRDNKLWIFYFDFSTYNFETHWGGLMTMYYSISEDYGDTWSSYHLYTCSGCLNPNGIELTNGTLVVYFHGDDLVSNVPDTTYYLRLTGSSWEGPYRLQSNVKHQWLPNAAYGPGGLYVIFTAGGAYYDNDIYIIPPMYSVKKTIEEPLTKTKTLTIEKTLTNSILTTVEKTMVTTLEKTVTVATTITTTIQIRETATILSTYISCVTLILVVFIAIILGVSIMKFMRRKV